MGRAANGTAEYAPVGDTLWNGFDLGGSRFYPWSTSLAITPPAEYSQNIGPGNSSIITPPVAALEGSAGAPIGGGSAIGRQASANPFNPNVSPLLWVVLGLIGAVFVMHELHYKGGV